MSILKVLSLAERLVRGALSFDDDPGLCEQSHKDACDINKIMATYAKTGLVPVYADQIPQQGDFTNVVDYHTASCAVKAAEQAFDALPASLRKAYNYDPDLFLKALDDPDERAKLIKLGVFVDPEASDSSAVPSSSGVQGNVSPGSSPSLEGGNA